ncbi:MAG: ABC transporter permease [Muribaculaceae bacterium]|jgi:putative ABC transport system permease protein|nr:ABC transporter permease [Muribaculaceae bacterium]
MKRKLLNQMLNEWRPNIWLVLELVIVVCVLYALFSSLYSTYLIYNRSEGMELNDVYFASLNFIEEDNENHAPYDSIHSPETDYALLLANLRSNPYVEVVGGGSPNSLPYLYNYWGTQIEIPQKGDRTRLQYQVNKRQMSPDMLRVLRIHGVDGQSPDELAELIAKGDIIISDRDYHNDPSEAKVDDFLGKDVYFYKDSLQTHHVGAIAYGMRRSDFEPMWSGNLYMNINFSDIKYVGIRVKPGTGHLFAESLSESDMQVGNLYLSDLKSIEDMRYSAQIEKYQDIRNKIIFAVFVLMVIFLGFLGSFWFRTQQRASEIAIRKVSGASDRAIYTRFFGEGMILLAVSIVLALPLIYGLSKTEMPGGWTLDVTQTATAGICTVLILAILIVAGIYAPALKATRIDIAEVLKNE